MRRSKAIHGYLSHKRNVLVLIVYSFYFIVIGDTSFFMPATLIHAQDEDDTHSSAFMTNGSLPITSPNPVGNSGTITLAANYTDDRSGVASVIWTIMGPNIGSSDPTLAPVSVGSSQLSLISGTNKEGTWSGTFTFPGNLPDGNYLYSLTATDGFGNQTNIGPISGIILNRHPPDATETDIISVVDDNGRSISNGSTTSSLSNNITFTFKGKDESGVILGFQCNLDDLQVLTEHQHDEQIDMISTFSPCFSPASIAQEIVGSYSYSNLLVGNHTFKVRAVDNEHNVDLSPSIFNWTIS